MKKILISSTNIRQFVTLIAEMGAEGATLDETCTARKGLVLATELVVPDDSVIQESQNVHITMQSRADAVTPKEFVYDPAKTYTAEELESLTIKQVKEVTGLKGRDKQAMIDEYIAATKTE